MTKNIAIFGDVMLDTYVHCSPERISSEAPVIIAKEVKRTYAPGGAANVAASLVEGFGISVELAGFVGDDSSCPKLVSCLINHSIDPERLITTYAGRTIEKVRFIDGLQRQKLRVDVDDLQVSDHQESQCQGQLKRMVKRCDALVISDYAKGSCTPWLVQEAINRFRAAGKFIVVNGKPQNFLMYAGASVLILNRAEALQAAQLHCDNSRRVEDSDSTLGWRLRSRLSAIDIGPVQPETDIIITRGDQGMLWCSGGDTKATFIEAKPVKVADVTGAGDTVTATIAAHGRLGLDVLNHAANNAAKVVSQHGSSLGRTP
jgi:D-beta-D-heptose 7-phosphate kinase/D-beta-D-heptose 1-phosphate adenosyltransferase